MSFFSSLGQPTAMAPQTAGGVLLVALAMMALAWAGGRRSVVAAGLALLPAVIAAMSLFETIAGVDLGLGRAFGPGSPAPASPNSSSALLFLAGALVAAGWRVRRGADPLASGALALALLALLGYATGLRPAYHWGDYSGMSLPSAIAFLLLGVGLLGALREGGDREWSPGLFFAGAVMLVSAGLSTSATNASLVESNRWIRHTLEVRELLLQVERQVELLDQIERAHYHTGDLATRLRESAAESELWIKLDRLGAAVGNNSAQLQRIAEVRTLVDVKVAGLRRLFGMGTTGIVPPEERRREVLAGLRATEKISAELDRMLGGEARLLADRIRESEMLSHETLQMTKLAMGVSLALLMAAAGITLRANRSRRATLQALERANARLEEDIVERRKLEVALAAARDAAVEASRLKSEFLANMSHELRTPMNGIIGVSELLLTAPLPREQRDMNEMVLHSAEALLTIINDILDFSKIEAGRLDMDAQPFDLRRVVEDCAVLLAPRSHEKGVELIVDVDRRLPARVVGDGGRVRQVIMNLAGNAVKFTAAGEVTLRVLVIGEVTASARVRVEVRDTGEGIPEDVQRRLFEPFTQADAATTRRHGGTGLGLAISRQLVELMGGHIAFESRPGKGSHFWFEVALPVAEVRTEEPEPVLTGRRFLVVDDSENNRRVVTGQLAAWGAEGDCAANGAEAETLLANGRSYAAILLDWHMPDRDGHTLAREWRERGLVGPHKTAVAHAILLMSSAASHPLATDATFDCVLVKPVRLEDLHRGLVEIVSEPRSSEQTPAGSREFPGPTGPRLELLLVEDNPSNQRVGRMMLQRLGHGVDVAADGQHALRALAERRYDAVFMDCQMPVLDGYAATQRIRSGEVPGIDSRTPVIALTANALPADRMKCLHAGMDDFITKPVRLEDMRAVLARVVPGVSTP